MDLVFVVSTGRCGSTLVSRLLNGHPDVLSIDELFSFLPIEGRLVGELDGGQFWRQISDPVPFIDAMLRDGVPLPELIYPYGTGRFNPETGVPLISHIILPVLSADPDALYDRLAVDVPRWPARSVPDQYRQLFSWLAADRGRPTVVERSGGSIRFVAHLRRAFPEARFVYLSRDGVDCALSMSKHPAFRLPILAEIMEASGELAKVAREAPGSGPILDRRTIAESPIPLSVFGSLWSGMTQKGAAELARMPAGSWTAVRYERLLSDPVSSLRALARFLGIGAPDFWLSWAAALIRPPRVSAPVDLDPDVLAELRHACLAGYDADTALRARCR